MRRSGSVPAGKEETPEDRLDPDEGQGPCGNEGPLDPLWRPFLTSQVHRSLVDRLNPGERGLSLPEVEVGVEREMGGGQVAFLKASGHVAQLFRFRNRQPSQRDPLQTPEHLGDRRGQRRLVRFRADPLPLRP